MSLLKLLRYFPKPPTAPAETSWDMVPYVFNQRNLFFNVAWGAGALNEVVFTVPAEKELYVTELYLCNRSQDPAAYRDARVAVYDAANAGYAWVAPAPYSSGVVAEVGAAPALPFVRNVVHIEYPLPLYLDQQLNIVAERDSVANQEIRVIIHGWERAKRA